MRRRCGRHMYEHNNNIYNIMLRYLDTRLQDLIARESIIS